MKPLDDDQSLALWNSLVGPRPQLLVPDTLKSVTPRPDMAVFHTLGEIKPRSAPKAARTVARLAGAFPKEQLLTICANVNNWMIAHGRTSSATAPDRDLCSDGLRERLRMVRGDIDAERVLFHRATLMTIMKIVLGARTMSRGLHFDQRALGWLAIAVNEVTERHGATSGNPKDLCCYFLRTWDLYNPRDLLAIARWEMLIDILQESSRKEIVSFRQRHQSTDFFPEISEFQIRAILFLTHFLVTNSVKREKSSIISVTEDIPAFFPARDELLKFLRDHSWSLSDFSDAQYGCDWSQDRVVELVNDPFFLADDRWIRERPLLALPDDRFQVLDLAMTIEAIISGWFWRLKKTLPPQEQIELFQVWGYVFEEYVCSLIGHYYPQSKLLSTIFSKQVPFNGKGEGEIDFVLDYGTFAVVAEIKSFTIPVAIRASGNVSDVEKYLRRRLVANEEGKRKGLSQLAAAAADYLSRPDAPRLVYPLLIVDEKVLEALGANVWLGEIFEEILDEGGWRLPGIMPVTLMTVDELETFLPYLSAGALDWRSVLDYRMLSSRQLSLLSFGQTTYELAESMSAAVSRNEFLFQKVERFMKDMSAAIAQSTEPEDQ